MTMELKEDLKMTKMWKMMLIVCCIALMIVSTSTMAVLAGELVKE